MKTTGKIYSSIFARDRIEKKAKKLKKARILLVKVSRNIKQSEPFVVKKYSELVRRVADLKYNNNQFTLYFRGQSENYTNNTGETTLYPSIYRPPIVNGALKDKFETLQKATECLNKIVKEKDIDRKKHIVDNKKLRYFDELKWAILQHYNVCSTPLIDLTSSLHVACSFAVMETDDDKSSKSKRKYGVVYILGLPYQHDNISYNTVENLLNIKLTSICSPEALRHIYQEGYLAGEFPMTELDNIYRVKYFDFSRRLIGKYYIPRSKTFWDFTSKAIEKAKLLPEKNDRFLEITNRIKSEIK